MLGGGGWITDGGGNVELGEPGEDAAANGGGDAPPPGPLPAAEVLPAGAGGAGAATSPSTRAVREAHKLTKVRQRRLDSAQDLTVHHERRLALVAFALENSISISKMEKLCDLLSGPLFGVTGLPRTLRRAVERLDDMRGHVSTAATTTTRVTMTNALLGHPISRAVYTCGLLPALVDIVTAPHGLTAPLLADPSAPPPAGGRIGQPWYAPDVVAACMAAAARVRPRLAALGYSEDDVLVLPLALVFFADETQSDRRGRTSPEVWQFMLLNATGADVGMTYVLSRFDHFSAKGVTQTAAIKTSLAVAYQQQVRAAFVAPMLEAEREGGFRLVARASVSRLPPGPQPLVALVPVTPCLVADCPAACGLLSTKSRHDRATGVHGDALASPPIDSVTGRVTLPPPRPASVAAALWAAAHAHGASAAAHKAVSAAGLRPTPPALLELSRGVAPPLAGAFAPGSSLFACILPDLLHTFGLGILYCRCWSRSRS